MAAGEMTSYQIRRYLFERGWASGDSFRFEGSGRTKPYYVIWFERTEWHGRHLSKCASYSASTDDPEKIEVTVKKAGRLALTAWNRFPRNPPIQGSDGNLYDT
jgi:hypothetical protein